MTTLDVALTFAGVMNLWYKANDFLEEKIASTAHWVVDASRATVLAYQRRRRYPKIGAHRAGGGKLAWDYLLDQPEREFGYEPKPAGQHRDTRGWRYRPAVWSLLERIEDECRWNRYWSNEVNRLIEDIQYMLSNPPQAETYHGCRDCRCAMSRSTL